MNWPKVCFTLSALSLIHSAYSAAQYRKYLRLTEQEYTYLPSDILTQALISLAICCYTICVLIGDFREVRLINDLENKAVESLMARPSFYVFNHRNKYLHSLLQLNSNLNKSDNLDNNYKELPELGNQQLFDQLEAAEEDIEKDLLKDEISSASSDSLH